MLVCSNAAIVVLSIVHWIIEQYDKHATFVCLSSSLLWENLLGLVEFCVSFGSALGNNHGFVIRKIIICGILALFVEGTGNMFWMRWDWRKRKGHPIPENQLNTTLESCSERCEASHLTQTFLRQLYRLWVQLAVVRLHLVCVAPSQMNLKSGAVWWTYERQHNTQLVAILNWVTGTSVHFYSSFLRKIPSFI